MMEHIFREFANRGINPFGYEDPDDDGVSDEDEDYSSSSSDPIEVMVVMTDDLAFEPDQIEVEVDRPVRLTVENAGKKPHDFTIDEIWIVREVGSTPSDQDEFDLHLVLEAGEMATLEFTPQRTGVYDFHCTVGSHTGDGMTGTLVVTLD